MSVHAEVCYDCPCVEAISILEHGPGISKCRHTANPFSDGHWATSLSAHLELLWALVLRSERGLHPVHPKLAMVQVNVSERYAQYIHGGYNAVGNSGFCSGATA